LHFHSSGTVAWWGMEGWERQSWWAGSLVYCTRTSAVT